jgi:hypothetical protein
MITPLQWIKNSFLSEHDDHNRVEVKGDHLYRLTTQNSMGTGGVMSADVSNWNTLVELFKDHEFELLTFYKYANNGMPEHQMDYIVRNGDDRFDICFNYQGHLCLMDISLIQAQPGRQFYLVELEQEEFLPLFAKLIEIESQKPEIRLRALTGELTFVYDYD